MVNPPKFTDLGACTYKYHDGSESILTVKLMHAREDDPNDLPCFCVWNEYDEGIIIHPGEQLEELIAAMRHGMAIHDRETMVKNPEEFKLPRIRRKKLP